MIRGTHDLGPLDQLVEVDRRLRGRGRGFAFRGCAAELSGAGVVEASAALRQRGSDLVLKDFG
eukprot:4058714-Pyramimonas_sp.AAC.1